MKNKLLITSALVGGLALTSVAEAKISGSYKMGYAMGEGKNATTPGVQGYNREVQIDMSTEGELNNGVKFKAGASLEQDGGETLFAGNEGNFVAFTMGDTTLEFGLDHAPNLDDGAVPYAGTYIGTVANAVGGAGVAGRNPSSPYGNFGVAVIQNTPYGAVSLNYVPQQGDTDGAKDHAAGNIEGKSAYELKLKGNLGVEGLTVVAGTNKRKFDSDDTAAKRDGEATSLSVAYNFGSVAIGYQDVENEKEDKTTVDTKIIGATFSISDTVTLGIAQEKNESSVAATKDEKINMLQVGYNLGAMTVELNYVDVENRAGTDQNDVSGASVYTSFKF
jgi:hypothetical protein